MRVLEKIKQTFGNLNQSMIRFPISMICSVIFTIYLILEIKNGSNVSNGRMIATFAMMVLVSINIHLLEESYLIQIQDVRKRRLSRVIAWSIGALFMGYMYFIFLKPSGTKLFDGYEKDGIYFGLNLFFVILATYISKIKRKEGYTIYVFHIIGGFAKALVYSIVMYLGLSAIIYTLVHLLDFLIASDIYAYMACVVFNLFFTAVFLSNFPGFADDFEGYKMVGAWKVLLLSIVVPLFSIYTIILYIYFTKISVLSQWPNGLVGHLVLWYGMLSIAVLFFIAPLQESKPFIKKFSIIYSIAMLPLLGMMFVSLWIRIGEYALTENRYYVIMAGIWVGCSALYYVWHYIKKQDSSLLWIPVILSVIVLISSVGPMNGYQMEKRSQVNELVKVLNKNEMIQDNKIVPKKDLEEKEKARISELVSYIMSHHQFEDIPNMPCSKQEYSFEKVFGFYEISQYEREEKESSYVEKAEMHFYRYYSNEVEDISKYTKKYKTEFYASYPEKSYETSKKLFVEKKDNSIIFYFYELGTKEDQVYTETIPLDQLYDKVAHMQEREKMGEQVEPYLDYEGNDVNYRIVLRNITLERTKLSDREHQEYKVVDIDCEVYYALKK